MKEIKFSREEYGEFILIKTDIEGWIIKFDGAEDYVTNVRIYEATEKEIPVIELYKYSDVVEKICNIKKVKPMDIKLAIPRETFEEIKRIDKEVLEARIKEEEEKNVEDWEFGIGGDTWKLRIWPIGVETEYRPDLKEVKEFIESHQSLFEDRLMEKAYNTRPSEGFYTRDGLMYVVKNEDLMAIYNEIYREVKAKKEAQERKEREEIEQAIRIARETGEPQLLYSFSTDCNNPYADCDLDIVYVYIDKDGKRFTERTHTY